MNDTHDINPDDPDGLDDMIDRMLAEPPKPKAKVKRPRKPKACAEPAPANALVSEAELLYPSPPGAVSVNNPDVFIKAALFNANLTPYVAEVVPYREANGAVSRVEFRGATGVTFCGPDNDGQAWVMYSGELDDFPEFLSKLTAQITIGA